MPLGRSGGFTHRRVCDRDVNDERTLLAAVDYSADRTRPSTPLRAAFLWEPLMRLPSFNDFSPHILKHDIRIPLRIVNRHKGDRDAAVADFATAFFEGKKNKRSSTNVPATLTSTGLLDGDTFRLTEFGKHVLAAATPSEAARRFAKGLLEEHNAHLVIDAARALYKRHATGSRKALLKKELEARGIELSNATTDHTTLENWLAEAGLLKDEGGFRRPDDGALKRLVGASSDELSELLALDAGHYLFLKSVRRRQEVGGPEAELPVSDLVEECLRDAPALFREDQFRASVIDPLEEAGWVVAARSRSGKSGWVKASEKLLRVPMDTVVPGYSGAVPPDIRAHLTKSAAEVEALLWDRSSKHNRGLGLELLAMRMLLDLGLEPQGFRTRAAETAYAEVDLEAEGRNLLFSRWVVQCKNITGNVALADVAKEVGVAVHRKAHVVAVVTTSDFSSEAVKFSLEVSEATHLQFLLVNGAVVRTYLRDGAASLLRFVLENASNVLEIKRRQPNIPQ